MLKLSKREIASRVFSLGEVVVPALEESSDIKDLKGLLESSKIGVEMPDRDFAIAIANVKGKEGGRVGLFFIPAEIYHFGEEDNNIEQANVIMDLPEILSVLRQKIYRREHDPNSYRKVETLDLSDLIRLGAAMNYFYPSAPLIALSGIGKFTEHGEIEHYALYQWNSSKQASSISTIRMSPFNRDIIVPVWLPPEDEQAIVGLPG